MKSLSLKKMKWLGYVLTVFVVVFLLFDSVIHIANIPPVVQAFTQLGFPDKYSVAIGIIELGCLILYIFPKTSILGAILLTGYLGGAVATNLRANMPLFSHILFPVYTGILLWGGIFLRSEKLREIFPFKK